MKDMKQLFSISMITLAAFLIGCNNGGDGTNTDGKYSYETVEGDPMQTRIYTLDNGLKVYLTVYKDEPRIQTLIAVRTGSKNDPAETTGLAHYLEHMVFKGTSTMATTNWEAEKVLLDKISDLYEEHKSTTDEEEKKRIYAMIDSCSHEASKFTVANEYDKMVSSIGATGTNAYTSNDETVYINNIPSNEFDKWAAVEGERFQELVLRLFHTELETVYEEFNRSQDWDGRWSYSKVLEGLYPNHPYGTQSTIGEGEHLKNPSMVNIHNYFDTYYRPNNVAICLSGDLDPEKTIETIDKYFGDWEAADIPEFEVQPLPEMNGPIEKETFGPQQEHVYVGFRFDGSGSEDEKYLSVVDMLLSNSAAGLIDLNLVHAQKVLDAYCFPNILNDYSTHFLYGEPRDGQTLEEVRDLLLAEVEKIKNGEFEQWQIDAVVKDLKLNQMKSMEENSGRAFMYVDAFINGKDWADVVGWLDELSAVTKDEVVAFANEKYTDNYVVSYKRFGEADRHKVEKPEITPVVINRDTVSPFYAEWNKMESNRLEPVFIDFEAEIEQEDLSSGLPMYYIKNELNGTFELNYLFDMGSWNDQELALAIDYLPYLGTNEYSAEELIEEFYKLGLSFDVYSSGREIRVSLSGLQESFGEGVELFEHILANVEPDEEVYQGLVSDIMTQRANDKTNKNSILRGGLVSIAKYGMDSPFRYILSEEQLRSVDVNQLVSKIHGLTSYDHTIFYYGEGDKESVSEVLNTHHLVPEERVAYPVAKTFDEVATDNKVLFAPYDMVQTEMMLLSKSQTYNPELAAAITLFNEYFGAGLSSIVFQEIREQKGLAYSAYSYVSSPRYSNESHYVNAYIGTQADKLGDAVSAMLALMDNMPEAEQQFEGAREAALKKIETDYITRSQKFWSYRRAQNRGLDYDLRKEIYAALENMTIEDLKAFFQENVSGNDYTFVVVGNKDNMDFDVLAELGEVEELTLEEVFNY